MSKKNRNKYPSSSPVQATVDVATVDGQKVSISTNDGFANFEAATGIQANNQLAKSSYSFDFLTKNRILLEAIYRTSWIIGHAVDIPAEDMTSGGIEMICDLSPDTIEIFDEQLDDKMVWESLCLALKWAGLYGSSVAIPMIDGADYTQPFRLEAVPRNGFKGLIVMDRWQLNPIVGTTVKEFGPNFGMPAYYDVNPDSISPNLGRIHYSWVLRFDSIDLPHYQKQTENMWSESKLERIHDRLLAFDSTTLGAAQLVYKAYLRTWSVKDLRNLISTGGKAYEAVLRNIEMVRRYQSNEGITLMDAEDKFESHQYTFSGLDSVLLKFGEQLSGAIEVPMVRLFGQSPAGLNSTGESDLRTYYDGVKRKQKKQLRRPVKRILEIISMSKTGQPLPNGFKFEFRPMWQLSDTEKAEIASKDATTIGGLFDSGLLSKPAALKELRQSAAITGRFSNITDEDIADAELEPPMSEMLVDPNGLDALSPQERTSNERQPSQLVEEP